MGATGTISCNFYTPCNIYQAYLICGQFTCRLDHLTAQHKCYKTRFILLPFPPALRKYLHIWYRICPSCWKRLYLMNTLVIHIFRFNIRIFNCKRPVGIDKICDTYRYKRIADKFNRRKIKIDERYLYYSNRAQVL